MSDTQATQQRKHARMEAPPIEKLYIGTAAVILICTAFFKFTEVIQHHAGLGARDPVFMFLKIWQAVLIAGLLELTSCVFLFSLDRVQRFLPLFSLSCVFVVYRLALGWVGGRAHVCHCLGSAAEWFGLDTMMANSLASLVLGYLLLGSLALLLFSPSGRTPKSAMRPLSGVRTRFGVFVLGLAMALFGHLTAALGVNYQVSGSVIRDYVKPDGSDGTSSNWFRVVVSNCRSSITAGAILDPKVEFQEYRCDGTNSSLLVKYAPDVYANPKKVANEATLTLNTGPVPEYGYGMISEVWLAYASACFYERSTSGRTEPVFFMGEGFREHHLTVNSEWKLTTSAPTLLERMCDFSDGFRYDEQNGTLLKERLPSPFDQGSTNAVYSVLRWTNYDGFTLPLEWQVVKYKPNLQTGRLERAFTTRGYTASVGTRETGINSAPLVPQKTYVIDNTLEAQDIPVPTYSYLTTNGQLRSLAELARDQAFQQALQDANKAQTLPGKRRLVAIIVAALLLFPLVPLLYRYWRGRSKEELQQKH